MKVKRIVALVMMMVMLFTINAPAFAVGMDSGTAETAQSSSFIDSEGKVNTVYISSPKKGAVHVDYYIEGVLVDIVDTEILDTPKTASELFDTEDNIRITYTNVRTSETEEYVDSISNYVTLPQTDMAYPVAEEALAASSYAYQGRINYRPFMEYADKLYIYQRYVDTLYEYRELNVVAGTLVAKAIGVIANALTFIFEPLKIVAEELIYSAAYALGVSIAEGKIQGALSGRYYVRSALYEVKACDLDTSRERVYDAERYQVLIDGNVYASQFFYDGYLPWNTNDVAYWMFCDFFGYQYPGVSSFTI